MAKIIYVALYPVLANNHLHIEIKKTIAKMFI